MGDFAKIFNRSSTFFVRSSSFFGLQPEQRVFLFERRTRESRVALPPKGMSPFEMQDILLPSGTNGVKDLLISTSHSSSLALFASLGKKLSVLSLDSSNLVVNYDLQVPAWFCSWDLNNSHYIYVGLQAVQASPSNVARGLSSLYKEIIVAYEKTQELARDLQVVGCGDLDVDSVM
ncbi:hypothetical protein D0Y65_048416 [Glycine soja]|uniref:Uncharacterized protein n=1 Tax=Glycine soja TaxID=3848 RepID=A0A445FSY7_GLYSO|nr:hypothetical protein D0Y65_048416 [Glycine soja]